MFVSLHQRWLKLVGLITVCTRGKSVAVNLHVSYDSASTGACYHPHTKAATANLPGKIEEITSLASLATRRVLNNVPGHKYARSTSFAVYLRLLQLRRIV